MIADKIKIDYIEEQVKILYEDETEYITIRFNDLVGNQDELVKAIRNSFTTE